MRTVRASELDQAVVDEVERTGEPVTILRGERPIALLVPTHVKPPLPPQRSLLGTVEILGDILDPVLPSDSWDAESGHAR